MFCREYSLVPIELAIVCRIICYPMYNSMCCTERLKELKELGIDMLYSFGKTVFYKGVNIVGKGHAALIVLARHVDYGVLALKTRRTDSKRISMEWEAYILNRVQTTGFAPKIYGYTTNFLLREFVDGCTLEELLTLYRGKKDDIVNALKSLIYAALAMDLASVDLIEISRPLKQVLYLCCNPLKPFFIDFESGKISSNPLNVTKILGFILSRSKIYRDVVISENQAKELLKLAKEYKSEVDTDKRKELVDSIIKILDQIIVK